ncbi:MAG: DUF1697 domain-containing protein [Ardenticatenaceae bacterium]|nr:DUF1697 domain-containing protein [Ardenticatenaceae bacterium]
MRRQFIALLRGINVGGHKKIKMADLRQMLTELGFTKVKTLLASGNVLFEADTTQADSLQQTIEAGIEASFGFPVPVLIRTREAVEALVASDPFAGIEVTHQTRLYITFLSQPPTSQLPIPYQSPDGSYHILSVTDTEICSVLTLTGTARTTDAMNILEKEFGKNITTRNWNTVLKLLDK